VSISIDCLFCFVKNKQLFVTREKYKIQFIKNEKKNDGIIFRRKKRSNLFSKKNQNLIPYISVHMVTNCTMSLLHYIVPPSSDLITKRNPKEKNYF